MEQKIENLELKLKSLELDIKKIKEFAILLDNHINKLELKIKYSESVINNKNIFNYSYTSNCPVIYQYISPLLK